MLAANPLIHGVGVLAGRRAMVVGGAGAIGQAIVHGLVHEGASVTVADKNVARAHEVAGAASQLGATSLAVEIDVLSETSVASAFESAADQMGGIDVLVNSAGVIFEAPTEEVSTSDWHRVIDLNLTGVFLCCRAVLPYMRQHGGGRIINIASQVGQRGGARLSHYSAAKAGVIGLTKALAREFAPEAILVNAVAPGPIDTSFSSTLSAETLASTAKALPLGRPGSPAEVAPSVVLLASSPGGDLYVGQTLGPNSGDVML